MILFYCAFDHVGMLICALLIFIIIIVVLCSSGLGHSAVQRLKNTWDKLPTKHSKAFEVSCTIKVFFFSILSTLAMINYFSR